MTKLSRNFHTNLLPVQLLMPRLLPGNEDKTSTLFSCVKVLPLCCWSNEVVSFVTGTFAKGIFADGIFVERNFRRKEFSPKGIFAERSFRRKEFSPKGIFAERIFRRTEFSPNGNLAERNFRGQIFRRAECSPKTKVCFVSQGNSRTYVAYFIVK